MAAVRTRAKWLFGGLACGGGFHYYQLHQKLHSSQALVVDAADRLAVTTTESTAALAAKLDRLERWAGLKPLLVKPTPTNANQRHLPPTTNAIAANQQVAVAGCSCSGKSTVAAQLAAAVNGGDPSEPIMQDTFFDYDGT